MRSRYAVVLAVAVWACGSAEQKTASTSDTLAAESSPPQVSAAMNQLSQPREKPGFENAEYIVHGVCPFECCKYGDWTMVNGGALRKEPDGSADSVGTFAAGATVHTDSGVMVLHPTGVAVIVGDASTSQDGPRAGDTVEVISYTGQKVTRVRWNGEELDKTDHVQMLRDPGQRWWVHVSDPSTLDGGGGWMLVSGVPAEMVGTPNSCSRKP